MRNEVAMLYKAMKSLLMFTKDFLSKVQELLLHQALGPSCLQLAEYLCLKFVDTKYQVLSD